MISTQSKGTYFPFIDGLRAIAVLSVFLYHLEPTWLPGGFTGVDVFFVISGFVISGSLANRDLDSFWAFVSYFYSRRIKRIMPALIVCVVVSAIAFVLFSIPGGQSPLGARNTALAALFGFSNIVLFSSEQGYFDQSTEMNPFTHTWSLGVEEQFYIIFPLLFFWWVKANATLGQRLLSSALFAGGLVISLVIAYLVRHGDPDFGFYLLPARFWELACGVLIYQLSVTHAGATFLRQRGIQALAAIGLLLVVAGFLVADKESFPFPWAFLPVMGTALLLASLLIDGDSKSANAIRAFLASNPMIYIGQRSYSMYLWHWPVLVMFRWTIGLEEFENKLIAILLTLIATEASFRLVERPVRSSRYLLTKSNRFAIVGGLAITALMLGATASVFHAQKRAALTVTSKGQLWYPKTRAFGDDLPCTSQYLSLPFSQSDQERPYRRFQTNCSGDSLNSMFVIGDSHAGHHMPIYRTLASSFPINVNVYTYEGCRYPESLVIAGRFTEECEQYGLASRQEVLSLAMPGDILFLPGNRVGSLKLSIEELNREVVSLERLKLELQPFLDKKMHIVLETAKPVFRAMADRCADWFNRTNANCVDGLAIEKAKIVKRAQKFVSVYAALSKEHSNVHLWEPLDILCPESECSAMVQGRPLFYDRTHISRYGNSILYPKFEDFVMSLLDTRTH